jgi:hypothetical protein
MGFIVRHLLPMQPDPKSKGHARAFAKCRGLGYSGKSASEALVYSWRREESMQGFLK